jgi:hypothetical protein
MAVSKFVVLVWNDTIDFLTKMCHFFGHTMDLMAYMQILPFDAGNNIFIYFEDLRCVLWFDNCLW